MSNWRRRTIAWGDALAEGGVTWDMAAEDTGGTGGGVVSGASEPSQIECRWCISGTAKAARVCAVMVT